MILHTAFLIAFGFSAFFFGFRTGLAKLTDHEYSEEQLAVIVGIAIVLLIIAVYLSSYL